jgi:hypothetical protein
MAGVASSNQWCPKCKRDTRHVENTGEKTVFCTVCNMSHKRKKRGKVW